MSIVLFFVACQNIDTTKQTDTQQLTPQIQDNQNKQDSKDNQNNHVKQNNQNNKDSKDKKNKQNSIEAKFINSANCDQIIDKIYFKICYDYKYKAAKSIAYTLEGDLVNEANIKERPRFYPDSALYDPYKAYDKDYAHSGYDRGHLAPDAAFDWSQESLKATYSFANIIPQDRDVNEKQWVKAEEHARKEAVILDEINVINVVIYSNKPETIGDNNISVSKGFYKIMYNKSKNYQECFYYENNASLNKKNLYDNKVNCKIIL